MKYLYGEYCYSLNSSDKYDLELPMTKSRAHGGTMILWKTCYDPFVLVHPVQTSSYLPIIFHPPGGLLSIHISIYLPTLGQESKFVDEMSKLSCTIDELAALHPEAPFFLRGDFNVSKKNKYRSDLLNFFSDEHNLQQVDITHPTYHHFLGGGSSDSFLDRIFFSRKLLLPESLQTILCKLLNPLVESHHDVVLTTWAIDTETVYENTNDQVVAPTIANN